MIAGHLDGTGHPGAAFREVLYLLNASPRTEVLDLPGERNKGDVLPPVHRAPGAADTRPREQARFDSRRGRFRVPPRTAIVYVLE